MMPSHVTEPFALVGDALLPQGRMRAALVVREGRVEAVVADPRDGDLPARRRDVGGLLAPGFVDLQVNGAFGADVGVDAAALEAISRALPRTGVTAYLPTAISWPRERYAGLFDAVERAAAAPGARILGVHLEGPFLAPSRAGAHDPANLRPVDPGELRELLGSGAVRVMTLAPELPGAVEAIELIVAAGAAASAGHTDATYEEVRARRGRRSHARHPPVQRDEPAAPSRARRRRGAARGSAAAHGDHRRRDPRPPRGAADRPREQGRGRADPRHRRHAGGGHAGRGL